MNYKKKFFISAVIVFFFYAVIIFLMQIKKEKEFQLEQQRTVLEAYSELIEDFLIYTQDTITVPKLLPKECRISIISEDGTLLFDNILEHGNNHADRPEINTARMKGKGSSIRVSGSTNISYLYFARETKNGNYIRIALPYVFNWYNFAKFNNIILYVIIILFFITILVLIFLSNKHGEVMETLNKFASDIANGNVINYEEVKFPDSAAGNIGEKIIDIYKQLENSKKQTDKAKERNRQIKKELSNNIAHELKTPVSSIKGYLEILLSDKPIEEDKRRHFLERSYAQTIRLSDLIRDISLINKMEEASELFVKERVNVKEIVEEALYELEYKIKERNITVKNSLTEDIFIPGNQSLVYAIFSNLIENAITHAGQNIMIGIENFKEDDNFFYFRFYDTGYGVKDEFLDKIFDRFLRIDDGRSRKNGGTGLGLSIVKNAVIFHNGHIDASNNINGGGLEFYFTLSKK